MVAIDAVTSTCHPDPFDIEVAMRPLVDEVRKVL